MFQRWGFLLAEIWVLLALAALLGLFVGWLIWGRRAETAPPDTSEADRLRAALESCSARGREAQARIAALEGDLARAAAEAALARAAAQVGAAQVAAAAPAPLAAMAPPPAAPAKAMSDAPAAAPAVKPQVRRAGRFGSLRKSRCLKSMG